jgi:hypothetical protein
MPAVVTDLRNQGDRAELQIPIARARTQLDQGHALRPRRPVDSAPISFDECQVQSCDPQVEAVKFEGLRLSEA